MLAALLGRDDEADHYFTQVIELTTRFRFLYLIAAAQLEWGAPSSSVRRQSPIRRGRS
jgi:hypothetical protein